MPAKHKKFRKVVESKVTLRKSIQNVMGFNHQTNALQRKIDGLFQLIFDDCTQKGQNADIEDKKRIYSELLTILRENSSAIQEDAVLFDFVKRRFADFLQKLEFIFSIQRVLPITSDLVNTLIDITSFVPNLECYPDFVKAVFRSDNMNLSRIALNLLKALARCPSFSQQLVFSETFLEIFDEVFFQSDVPLRRHMLISFISSVSNAASSLDDEVLSIVGHILSLLNQTRSSAVISDTISFISKFIKAHAGSANNVLTKFTSSGMLEQLIAYITPDYSSRAQDLFCPLLTLSSLEDPLVPNVGIFSQFWIFMVQTQNNAIFSICFSILTDLITSLKVNIKRLITLIDIKQVIQKPFLSYQPAFSLLCPFFQAAVNKMFPFSYDLLVFILKVEHNQMLLKQISSSIFRLLSDPGNSITLDQVDQLTDLFFDEIPPNETAKLLTDHESMQRLLIVMFKRSSSQQTRILNSILLLEDSFEDKNAFLSITKQVICENISTEQIAFLLNRFSPRLCQILPQMIKNSQTLGAIFLELDGLNRLEAQFDDPLCTEESMIKLVFALEHSTDRYKLNRTIANLRPEHRLFKLQPESYHIFSDLKLPVLWPFINYPIASLTKYQIYELSIFALPICLRLRLFPPDFSLIVSQYISSEYIEDTITHINIPKNLFNKTIDRFPIYELGRLTIDQSLQGFTIWIKVVTQKPFTIFTFDGVECKYTNMSLQFNVDNEPVAFPFNVNEWHFISVSTGTWDFLKGGNIIVDNVAYNLKQSIQIKKVVFGSDTSIFYMSKAVRSLESSSLDINAICQIYRKGPGFIKEVPGTRLIEKFTREEKVMIVPYRGIEQFLRIPYFLHVLVKRAINNNGDLLSTIHLLASLFYIGQHPNRDMLNSIIFLTWRLPIDVLQVAIPNILLSSCDFLRDHVLSSFLTNIQLYSMYDIASLTSLLESFKILYSKMTPRQVLRLCSFLISIVLSKELSNEFFQYLINLILYLSNTHDCNPPMKVLTMASLFSAISHRVLILDTIQRKSNFFEVFGNLIDPNWILIGIGLNDDVETAVTKLKFLFHARKIDPSLETTVTIQPSKLVLNPLYWTAFFSVLTGIDGFDQDISVFESQPIQAHFLFSSLLLLVFTSVFIETFLMNPELIPLFRFGVTFLNDSLRSNFNLIKNEPYLEILCTFSYLPILFRNDELRSYLSSHYAMSEPFIFKSMIQPIIKDLKLLFNFNTEDPFCNSIITNTSHLLAFFESFINSSVDDNNLDLVMEQMLYPKLIASILCHCAFHSRKYFLRFLFVILDTEGYRNRKVLHLNMRYFFDALIPSLENGLPSTMQVLLIFLIKKFTDEDLRECHEILMPFFAQLAKMNTLPSDLRTLTKILLMKLVGCFRLCSEELFNFLLDNIETLFSPNLGSNFMFTAFVFVRVVQFIPDPHELFPSCVFHLADRLSSKFITKILAFKTISKQELSLLIDGVRLFVKEGYHSMEEWLIEKQDAYDYAIHHLLNTNTLIENEWKKEEVKVEIPEKISMYCFYNIFWTKEKEFFFDHSLFTEARDKFQSYFKQFTSARLDISIRKHELRAFEMQKLMEYTPTGLMKCSNCSASFSPPRAIIPVYKSVIDPPMVEDFFSQNRMWLPIFRKVFSAFGNLHGPYPTKFISYGSRITSVFFESHSHLIVLMDFGYDLERKILYLIDQSPRELINSNGQFYGRPVLIIPFSEILTMSMDSNSLYVCPLRFPQFGLSFSSYIIDVVSRFLQPLISKRPIEMVIDEWESSKISNFDFILDVNRLTGRLILLEANPPLFPSQKIGIQHLSFDQGNDIEETFDAISHIEDSDLVANWVFGNFSSIVSESILECYPKDSKKNTCADCGVTHQQNAVLLGIDSIAVLRKKFVDLTHAELSHDRTFLCTDFSNGISSVYYIRNKTSLTLVSSYVVALGSITSISSKFRVAASRLDHKVVVWDFITARQITTIELDRSVEGVLFDECYGLMWMWTYISLALYTINGVFLTSLPFRLKIQTVILKRPFQLIVNFTNGTSKTIKYSDSSHQFVATL